MTRIEALRILVRYMPERSIHITESLDSNVYQGDRTDKETAFVTVSPGITRVAEECFFATTVEAAVKRVFDVRETQRDAEDNTMRAESFAEAMA